MTNISTGKTFFAAVVAGIAGVLLVTSPVHALPEETLDQQFETPADFNDWNGIYYLPEDIQTFTAGSAGTLSSVQLELYKLGMTLVNNLRLRVFPTDSNGKPVIDGAPLAVTTAAGSQLTDNKAWVSFSFSTPAQLVSGTRYALALTLDGEGDLEENPHWAAFSRAGDTFPSGQSCVDSSPQASPHEFLCNDSSDLGFRTFMSSGGDGSPEQPSAAGEPEMPNTGSNLGTLLTAGGLAAVSVVGGALILWRRKTRS